MLLLFLRPWVRLASQALKLVPLEPALHKRLGEALAQECEAYWADRRALSWN